MLYFHTIISNLNCFQKDIGINFYCRAPFQLNDYPSDKCNVKKNVYQECVHLCLPLFACPVCHFTYITHSCLHMHITKAHGGPRTAVSFL